MYINLLIFEHCCFQQQHTTTTAAHKQAQGLLPPPHEYAVVLWEHEVVVVRDHLYVFSALLFIIRVPAFYIIAVYTLAKAVSQ